MFQPTDPASREPVDYALAGRPTRGSRRTFRERWLRIWAELAVSRRRPDKALRRLMKLEAIRPLGLDEMAFRAQLFLRSGDPERAYDLFIAVREALKEREGPVADYVRHYALSWLAALRFDPFNAAAYDRAAAKIDCPRELREFLWLPSGEPRTDKLDAEFDKWVRANHPSDEDVRARRG